MLTNFEHITRELSDEERRLLPVLIAGFAKRTKSNPVHAEYVVSKINEKKIIEGVFTQSRLRKLCNFIRRNGLLPLVATSKGYYVSRDNAEIRRAVRSLYERANAIVTAAKGLEKFITSDDSKGI